MFFAPSQNEAQQRRKRCSYQCTCGNQWSVTLEVGDRKLRRRCLRCKEPCYPAATTYTVPSKRAPRSR